MFRPGYIQPLDGIQSRTRWYRVVYAAIAPLYPVLKRLFPGAVTTTAQVGRAMLAVSRNGFGRPVRQPPPMSRTSPARTTKQSRNRACLDAPPSSVFWAES